MDLADRSHLIGRTAELARLDELLEALDAGRGGVAWLQGEPGIGKSALAPAAAGAAAAAGHLVLRAAGEELMQPFPLRFMADCLGVSVLSPDPLAAQIAGLLRGDPGGGLDPVMTAAERMLELMDRLCAIGPVLLVTEDLQWSDEPSLLLWGRLARSVSQIPLLLVGTTRPSARPGRLDRLRELAAEVGTIIDLAPLDVAAAAEVAGQLAAGQPGPRLSAALARAGGNPLYIRELVDALVRDGRVEITGATADLTGDSSATPPSLQVAISGRLGFMSEATRAALRLAALLGNEFDAVELAAVTGQPSTSLAGLLAEALADGALADAGARFRFRHELIHQVLVAETPSAIRPALHTEIAGVLARAGRPADSVARHLLAVPGPLDEWALSWLAAVPESALYALPEVATDLLGRAVESAGPDGPRWETMAARLALTHLWLGRNAEAGQMAADIVARTGDRVLAARMRIVLIRALGRLDRVADAVPAGLRSPQDDDLPPLWRSRLGAWSALLATRTGDAAAGEALAGDALARARAAGDPLTIAYAEHAAALCYPTESMLDHINAGLAALSSQDPESMDLRMVLTGNQLGAAMSLAEPGAAQGMLARAVQLALADGAGTYRSATVLASAATVCYRYGRWDDAVVHLESIDREFTGTGRHLSSLHGLAALIALRREDRGTADAHLEAGIAAWPDIVASPAVPLDPLTQALALRAEADGDLAGAVSIMSAWLTAQPGLSHEHRFDDLHHLARIALAAGDRATAQAAAAVCRADAAADSSPGRQIVAEFCTALLNGDAGALLAVAGQYADLGWLPFQAAALEEAAVALAAAGDAARGRAALTAATRIYAELGASWDARRADARLRPHGVRRGPRSAHRRATSGWAALTPTEARIADMVARGLSNPDIAAELYLSRRTVQTHVSHILRKLSLRSRVGIATARLP